MDEPHNQTYTPSIHYNSTHWNSASYTLSVYICQSLILVFTFLGLCFTVFGLYSVVKSKTDRFVPVYVVNIFICDLIQTSSVLISTSVNIHYHQLTIHSIQIAIEITNNVMTAMNIIYYISVGANISFMVCVSAERYLLIAHPIWYNMNTNTIRKVFVSVTIWVISTVLTSVLFNIRWNYQESIGLAVFGLLFFILPYPLVIVFFVGTWRGLSSNTTIPPPGQRRIMGTLALVLFIYTVSFLPFMVSTYSLIFTEMYSATFYFSRLAAEIVMKLNPLFDFLLYLVMRKDAKDILSALCFCCHKRNAQNSATDTMREDQV